MVKNPPVNAGDERDLGSIPGLGRLLGEGNGSPPLYSCLGIPMDRGAWWAIVHGVAKSWTWQHKHRAHTHIFKQSYVVICLDFSRVLHNEVTHVKHPLFL